jgi:hypothetical protein
MALLGLSAVAAKQKRKSCGRSPPQARGRTAARRKRLFSGAVIIRHRLWGRKVGESAVRFCVDRTPRLAAERNLIVSKGLKQREETG